MKGVYVLDAALLGSVGVLDMTTGERVVISKMNYNSIKH
jgi:hypothetical protein